MDLYPNYYCDRITDIEVDFLKKNNIKALILDVDNTLLDTDKIVLEGLEEWHKKIVDAGIESIIVSNSNKLDKIQNMAKLLNISYIRLALKPLKRGLKKAQKQLNIPFENIAAIGDQIFTDVIGANRCGMFSILVKPINEKDLWMTKWKRPIENKIIQKYLDKINSKEE